MKGKIAQYHHRDIRRYLLYMYIVDTKETMGWLWTLPVKVKVVQHLIKCMDCHQLKTVIMQIDYTSSAIEMTQK